MARHYISVDRNQQFLVPPDMAEWLGPDHLAWFVIEAVERFDTASLHGLKRRGGAGRAGYDPDMLLALVLYGYCTGQRSSRQIERLCEVDVAYRVIAANNAPDHTTIARFRQDHQHVAHDLFVDVLMLAKDAGALNLGVVAIDGTKMAADASSGANRSRRQIEKTVAEILKEANEIDAQENELYGDKRGDELPEALTDPASRRRLLDEALAKNRKAKEVLDQRQENENHKSPSARLDQAIAREADRAARVEVLQASDAAHNERLGLRPKGKGYRLFPPEGSWELRLAKEQLAAATTKREAWDKRVSPGGHKASTANLTDPDSRMLKSQKGWVQGYNAQGIVDQNGILIAADIHDSGTDVGAYCPLVTQAMENLAAADCNEEIGTVVADAGYWSKANLEAPGPKRLIADTKSYKLATAGDQKPESPHAVVRQNHDQLRSPGGRTTYKKRQHMIEPAFGHLKHNRGFRRFIRRGTNAVRAEWLLMLTAQNLTKLHTLAAGG